MDIHREAINKIVKSVYACAENLVADASFDITVKGIIKERVNPNLYIVTVQGADYKLPYGFNDQTFNVQDCVRICFPQGNRSDGFINGRVR